MRSGSLDFDRPKAHPLEDKFFKPDEIPATADDVNQVLFSPKKD